ncbi:flagellar hook-associated protein FlgL [Nitratidesulfovibrio sp. D1]|uniref:flagellar hook-associated protein FlgL n=1 Tax=Nitratidesulfovibrio sp. D1 TaxID=3440151 RepID=UPI003EBBE3A1
MAGRVSQRTMFDNYVSNMNYALSNLMESNMQASSQKQVNRPSDDPVGMARILNYRASLATNEQYQKNVSQAESWLSLADKTLTQVSTVLTRIKALAEQAATGTVSPENRKEISYEMRELYEQLINLANTENEGRHIFAGHKIEDAAYVAGLAVTANDPAMASTSFTVEGGASNTIVFQFLESGTIGADALDYRYSEDGGATWKTGTLASNAAPVMLGGARLTMTPGATVTAVDTANDHETDNGTWLYIRPTAIYKGDDFNSTGLTADRYGAANIAATADGSFPRDVMVRIDQSGTLNGAISYSYSMDGGSSWVPATASGTGGPVSLLVPGGFLTLASNGGNALTAGDQFVIRPHRASLEYEISPGEYMSVNNVGKDIFGGLYQAPGQSRATAVYGGDGRNMFEVLGRLIAFTETNSQTGIQQALDELGTASKVILTAAARVGGKENRLDVVQGILESQEDDQTMRMSSIEDVDVAKLMTQLAQQQLTYNSVLKSSSMIMQMNLTNFL